MNANISQNASSIVFQKKGNQIIDELNKIWRVELPDAQFGTAQFKSDDGKVILDLTSMGVVSLKACNDAGEQVTVTLLGFIGTPTAG